MTGIVDRLNARFAGVVTPQDLADLDAEISRLQVIRSVVASVLVPAPTPLVGAPEPRKAPEAPAGNSRPAAQKPAPREQKPERKPSRVPNVALAEERRRKIAALLAPGPRSPKELSKALGLSQFVLYEALKHEWFEKSGPKLRDPFRLTAVGREKWQAAKS